MLGRSDMFFPRSQKNMRTSSALTDTQEMQQAPWPAIHFALNVLQLACCVGLTDTMRLRAMLFSMFSVVRG